MVARYGDFVLLKPPVKPETYLLWFGPGVILVLASLGAGLYLRRRRMTAGTAASAAPALNAEERARLERLLADKGEGPARD